MAGLTCPPGYTCPCPTGQDIVTTASGPAYGPCSYRCSGSDTWYACPGTTGGAVEGVYPGASALGIATLAFGGLLAAIYISQKRKPWYEEQR